MPRRYITVAEQQPIIERANRREYCKSAMDYTSQPFMMEQFATQSVTDLNQVTSLRTVSDRGEAEAIALAWEPNAELLSMDESPGRAIAATMWHQHHRRFGRVVGGKVTTNTIAPRSQTQQLVMQSVQIQSESSSGNVQMK